MYNIPPLWVCFLNQTMGPFSNLQHIHPGVVELKSPALGDLTTGWKEATIHIKVVLIHLRGN